jgi:Cation transporter/ATPase, N-terminus
VTSLADAVAPSTGIDLATAAAAAPQEVLKRLGSSDSGLSATEAADRLERYGVMEVFAGAVNTETILRAYQTSS